MNIKLKSKISKIKAFVFDVDGVFTESSIIIGDHDVFRIFNVKDGYALQMALKAGYKIAIISGGKQQSIHTRLRGLGVHDIFLSVGTDKKLEVYDQYIKDNDLLESETLFIGDDIPDYLVMKNRDCLSCCPADAVNEVLDLVDYISPVLGGRGAVRDVIELVMKAHGKWLQVF